ncbi:cell division protein FtsL [bacterium BMS3Abin15]|nr:cell division protein FtsL [bacterium BMS3Abin15]HDZ85748.1 hypothetical protein [Candidatus Moranbacteria bacterium]
MIKRRIVAKRKNFHWQPSVHSIGGKPARHSLRPPATARHERAGRQALAGGTKIKSKQILGSINLSFVVVFFIILSGIIYMYSINNSAVKGYKIRQEEKEISGLKKSNEQLRIKEAELKSLYHIEEISKKLNMTELNNISYIDETSPVALR